MTYPVFHYMDIVNNVSGMELIKNLGDSDSRFAKLSLGDLAWIYQSVLAPLACHRFLNNRKQEYDLIRMSLVRYFTKHQHQHLFQIVEDWYQDKPIDYNALRRKQMILSRMVEGGSISIPIRLLYHAYSIVTQQNITKHLREVVRLSGRDRHLRSLQMQDILRLHPPSDIIVKLISIT